jgi:hypothetical protein
MVCCDSTSGLYRLYTIVLWCVVTVLLDCVSSLCGFVCVFVCSHACVIVCFRDAICPVRYALCQCVKGEGLVTVDSQGVLRAGPDTGSALLEVIAVETCGVNQTLLISVRVSWSRVSFDGIHSKVDLVRN